MTDKKEKKSIINIIWIGLVFSSIFIALFTGKMEALTNASFESAKTAVTLAIGLVGAMALWLGLIRIAEDAGLMTVIARRLKPVMSRLFPDVPPEHPAMSAMVMNMSANIMGLGNAATPLGIKAMQELDKLNPCKGTATNAMCLFLAINTSSVTILPLGVIAVRSAAASGDPGGILLPSLLATAFSTIIAIIAATFLARIDKKYSQVETIGSISFENADNLSNDCKIIEPLKPIGWKRMLVPVFTGVFMLALGFEILKQMSGNGDSVSLLTSITHWLIPFIMGLLIVWGVSRDVHVYESLCEGAKEGFNVALKIIPFLVAILVAIGMFRASGALDILTGILSPITKIIGMPPETLPMAIVRPLSGSGAFGVMSDLVARDPDSISAFIASIMQGSTETTFYVLAIYFGAVQVTHIRHAVLAALIADGAGILAAVFLGNIFFRG